MTHLSKERIAEIENLKNSIRIVGNVQAVIALRDMLAERREMLAIIKMQLESSGDCRCNGCKRGREFLKATGEIE